MIDLLGNVSFSLVIVGGLVLIGGFMLVASLNNPKNARHPEGRKGRLRDELIVLSTFAPMLVMVLVGAFADHLRETVWWQVIFLGLAGLGLLGTFLPVVRRARQRIVALQPKFPPQ